jgi:hypothetical protein
MFSVVAESPDVQTCNVSKKTLVYSNPLNLSDYFIAAGLTEMRTMTTGNNGVQTQKTYYLILIDEKIGSIAYQKTLQHELCNVNQFKLGLQPDVAQCMAFTSDIYYDLLRAGWYG